MDGLARQALWWQPADAGVPAAAEALRRMRLLTENGGKSTPEAFTLQSAFPPPPDPL